MVVSIAGNQAGGVEKPGRINNPEAVARARRRDGVCLAGLILRDGCVSGYDVHHIDTRGSGGDDVLPNLICLCRKHHNAAHQGFITRGRLRSILALYWNYEYTPEQLEEQ